jgi:hypothetical protein
MAGRALSGQGGPTPGILPCSWLWQGRSTTLGVPGSPPAQERFKKRPFLTHSLTHTHLDTKNIYDYQCYIPYIIGLKNQIAKTKQSKIFNKINLFCLD